MIEMINILLEFFSVSVCAFLIFNKVINFKCSRIRYIIGIILSIIVSISFYVIDGYINKIIAFIFLYLLFSIVMKFITKNKIYYSVIIGIISVSISFISYMFSRLIIGVIVAVIGSILGLRESDIDINNIFLNIVTVLLHCIIIYCFIRIKRFKNGIAFFLNEKNKHYINLVGLIFCCVVIVIFVSISSIEGMEDGMLFIVLACGTIVVGISIVRWLQDNIVLDFNKKMSQKTIEEQENIIKEKDQEIERLKNDLFNSSKVIHSFKHRIAALESNVKNNLNMETAKEIAVSVAEIEDLSKDLQNNIDKNKSYNVKLPTTNVLGIDNILNYMSERARNNNIEFNLKVNGSINYMIEKIVQQNDLETLIGDLLENSIIAINSSANSYRAILFIIGLVDDCYGFCVYDSGKEFEIDTLIKLGLEPATTHSSDGGSGIGFITTFEMLNKCKASLIIEEKKVNNVGYTKSITIRFDGQNKYIVKTYRSESLKSKNKDCRIEIEEL